MHTYTVNASRQWIGFLIPALIVLLGVLHALVYALVMPPWGLLDEQQHFHYVQMIAQEQRAPIMWHDRLSEEIVDSTFAVKRYITLGSDRMPSREEFDATFDAYSYEGHHPPMYYALLAPFYLLGPSDVVGNLFFLRIVGALLSSATLLLVWTSARWLWPDAPLIAIVATLFVALNPERAASAGRMNNDLMVEIASAGAFACLASGWKRGTNWRWAILTGLCLGTAILSKLSAWVILPAVALGWTWAGILYCQPARRIIGQALAIVAIAGVCLASVIARNVVLYDEPTGVGAFVAHIPPLVSGSLSERVVTGIADLIRNSWAITWDGARVVTKPSAALMQLALALLSAFLVYRLVKAWSRQDTQLIPAVRSVLAIAGIALVLTAASTLLSYVQGLTPAVQGRFLLPALLPSAWLMGFGIWWLGKYWRSLAAVLLVFLEVALGMSVLFFHALPKFYAPRDQGFLGYWGQTYYLFFDPTGMFWDKPSFVNLWTVSLVITSFVFCGGMLSLTLWLRYGSPVHAYHWNVIRKTICAWQMPPAKVHTVTTVAESDSPPFVQGGMSVALGSVTRTLRLMLRDPLIWTTCGLLVFYLIWVAFYPSEIFWSLDEGGKYLHVQSIARAGNPSTPLPYPGRYLDRNLQFVPLMFWSRSEDQIYSWWPVGFPLISTALYLVFGWYGVYILPVVCGAVTSLLAGLLVRSIIPHTKWLAVIATLIAGLTTPVTFYSTTFWEHTLSVALVMGSILATLHAWHRGRIAWLVAGGTFLALSAYFRSDMLAVAAGMLLALLVIHWRWGILFGMSCILGTIPGLLVNWLLMGHVFGRQFLPGGTVEWSPLFAGVQDTGIWFVPYVLFNSPRVGAFAIEPGLVTLATLCTAVALLYPCMPNRRWIALMAYGVVVLICGWVLAQAEGYRSVHGFVLIAPHVLFATWLYGTYIRRREPPFPFLLVGICIIYAMVYVVRAWVPAGGLQWGPRYQLVFYPLFVAASLAGLVNEWHSFGKWMKRGAVTLYTIGVLIGLGFQVRGLLSAQQTRYYYQLSEQAVRQLPSETVVTSCSWLAMVMPRLYWEGKIFKVDSEASLGAWVGEARRVGVRSTCRVEMDMCSTTPLDRIALGRAVNPGGLEVQCYAE